MITTEEFLLKQYSREKYIFVKNFIILALVFLPVVVIQSLFFNEDANIFEIIFLSGVWLVILANLIHVTRTENLQTSARFLAALTLLGFTFFIITGGIDGAGLYIIFAYPGILFFMLGKKEGLFWILLYASTLGLFIILKEIFDFYAFYTIGNLVFTLTVFLAFTAIFYLYERMRERIESKLVLSVKVIDQERAELDRLVESIGDGVVTINRDWTITQWNKAASEISGWTAAEALGRNLRERIKFLRERDRSENITFIEDTMVKGKPQSINEKTVLVRIDGEEVPVGDSASPIFDENGKVVGATVIFRNVEKERKTQALRSDFKYASHQFRTPVGKILWSLETAKDKSDPHEKDKLIETAYYAAKSINKMSDQFLVITEIDQELVIPKYAKLALKDLVDKEVQNIDKDYVGKHMTFEVITSELNEVESDEKLITRIVEELLDNALKYSNPESKIIIKIYKSYDAQIIEVIDSGIGIVEEEQPFIFTKFFRGSNFDTTNIPGAGMGLYICRAYANLLEGDIWFKSKPGETIFFVKIPIGKNNNDN